jgi:phosphohistidine phosphatase SixA
MEIADWLACGMCAEVCFAELVAYQHLAMVILVGHEPDFGEAMGWILGMESSEALHIRKASLSAIAVSSFSRGGGRLEFCLPPRLM